MPPPFTYCRATTVVVDSSSKGATTTEELDRWSLYHERKGRMVDGTGCYRHDSQSPVALQAGDALEVLGGPWFPHGSVPRVSNSHRQLSVPTENSTTTVLIVQQ